VWASGPVWTDAENLAPPGFDPWNVQPVGSRYSDYATWPTDLHSKRENYELLAITEVIKFDLDRRGFTRHGQHRNAKGKELMAKRIAAAIERTFKLCEKIPISMKWKEDPSKGNQGLGETKNGVGEGRYPIENQNDSVSVENNNNRREEDETAMKATRRCRKMPVARRDDFFVGSRQKK